MQAEDQLTDALGALSRPLDFSDEETDGGDSAVAAVLHSTKLRQRHSLGDVLVSIPKLSRKSLSLSSSDKVTASRAEPSSSDSSVGNGLHLSPSLLASVSGNHDFTDSALCPGPPAEASTQPVKTKSGEQNVDAVPHYRHFVWTNITWSDLVTLLIVIYLVALCCYMFSPQLPFI